MAFPSPTPTSVICTTHGRARARSAPVRRDMRRSCGRRTRRSARSSASSPRTGSPRPTRSSWSPRTRVTTSSAGRRRPPGGRGPPAPAGCNGVTVPCSYSTVGEVNGNLTGMLGAAGISTPFDVEADSAPALYVHGQPARTASAVRSLEQATARLAEPDLAAGKTVRLTNYLADPVELKLLHMITGDPRRTPSLVLFGNTDFWLSSGAASCGASCVSEPAGTDAWNHGTVSPQINTTWLGLVGPGVARGGVDGSTWSDHTDIQPTMMNLLGLRDDYTPDGRVLVE